MTAQELHDLYAPLWEKVPETKPAYLDKIEILPVDGYAKEWFLDNGVRPGAEMRAALCRVAVEDWLRSRGILTIHSFPIPGSTGTGYRLSFNGRYNMTDGVCTNLHKGLVELAAWTHEAYAASDPAPAI